MEVPYLTQNCSYILFFWGAKNSTMTHTSGSDQHLKNKRQCVSGSVCEATTKSDLALATVDMDLKCPSLLSGFIFVYVWPCNIMTAVIFCMQINVPVILVFCLSVSAFEETDIPPSERPQRWPSDGCGPLLLHPWPGNSHDWNHPAGVVGHQWHRGNSSAKGMLQKNGHEFWISDIYKQVT